MHRSFPRVAALLAVGLVTLFGGSALATDDCGAGVIDYYEWQCTDDGWYLEQVGSVSYTQAGAIDSQWGESWGGFECTQSERTIGGGGHEGDDLPTCFWWLDCPLPDPDRCPVVPDEADYPDDEVDQFETKDPEPPRDTPPPGEVKK